MREGPRATLYPPDHHPSVARSRQAMDLAERILTRLSSGDGASADTLDLSREWGLDHQKVVGAVKSLQSLDGMVEVEDRASKSWELTAEGNEVAERGSHEFLAFSAVPEGGQGQPELMKKVNKVGFSKAMSAGWIAIDKSSGKPVVVRKVPSVEDKVRQHLAIIKAGMSDEVGEKEKADYKKRKLLQEAQVKSYVVKRGAKFTTKIEKGQTDLTPEMLSSGSWRTATFKDYNFDALGSLPPAGHLHPLLKVRAEYRQIFLEMGFTEMPTNNYVESSFWNFDALFVPQKHPARDEQDTFFVSDPAMANFFPEDYKERVSRVHHVGDYGSQGYGVWSDEETRKNTLRTHTTAVSARMLHALASQGEFKPAKYFSIDRVFRNETLDATHLAEFHQIEGVIADWDLSLGDLIGVLYEFFRKLGIEKLRFKPATNPYTEPSMEVFSYHEGLKKWVEIGNSGVFRPEMLLPMGLPEGVSVLGYGLSLERPTMIKYGLDNIRDLCGNKVNLKMVQENPLCRLDKDTREPRATLVEVTERRWEQIGEKLEVMAARIKRSQEVLGLESSSRASAARAQKRESNNSSNNSMMVIRADPFRPPHSVRAFIRLLGTKRRVRTASHCHSSITKLDPGLEGFLDLPDGADVSNPDLSVTLIWKQERKGVERLPSVAVDGQATAVCGEAELARYLARMSGGAVPYDDALTARDCARLDALIDVASGLDADGRGAGRTLEDALADGRRAEWISLGSSGAPSLAGLLLWSWHRRRCRGAQPHLGANFKKWLKEYSTLNLVLGLS